MKQQESGGELRERQTVVVHPHLLLLAVWVILGLGLRFANLGGKSASSIELSTLAFGLGHGLSEIPLDRVIDLETLLAPLQVDGTATARDVVSHLMTESTHPPLYFLLTHVWLLGFSAKGTLASLTVARSLSASIGVMSIPAAFALARYAFRSQWAAQVAAALMAVSPFGIYLAQEARHYTLAILWILASLGCAIAAVRSIERRQPLPLPVVGAWALANGLGMASHYFFALTLGAEGLAVGSYWLRDVFTRSQSWAGAVRIAVDRHWQRIYLAAIGSAIASLVWLPALQGASDSELTDWIATGTSFGEALEPLGRLLAWWITMLILLPVEGTPVLVTVASGVTIVAVLAILVPHLRRGLQVLKEVPQTRSSLGLLGGYLLGAIALVLLTIYGLGKDISLAARYHFVYFPAVLLLVAGALSANRLAISQPQSSDSRRFRRFCLTGKQAIALTLVMGILGALTVTSNFGFQKSRRSDLLVNHMQSNSNDPVLIATTYETHAEIRALMGLAYDFVRASQTLPGISLERATTGSPHFLLEKRQQTQSNSSTQAIATALETLPLPLNLWLVDYENEVDSDALGCQEDTGDRPDIAGYSFHQYRCQ